jgi:diguanylate cyclase (GGDEF)-like protein/PAS domain S-box-containing protein
MLRREEHVMFIDGAYSPPLIILSVVISIISSYTALMLVSRMLGSGKMRRRIFLLAGSVVMGTGIFSMHYIGMLAFHQGTQMTYDVSFTILSLIGVILFSLAALSILNDERLCKMKIVLSGFIIGAGMNSMHYLGVFAIKEPLLIQYKSVYFILSILTAFLLSTIAMFIFIAVEKSTRISIFGNLISAGLLGIAVSLMHYIGMKAILFTIQPDSLIFNGMDSSNTVAVIVSLLTTTIIIVAICFAFLDYRTFKTCKRSEMQYDSLFKNNPDGILTFDLRGNLMSVNSAGEMILGNDIKKNIGSHFSKWVPSEILSTITEYFNESLNGKLNDFETTFEHQSKGKRILYVRHVSMTLDREVVGVFCIIKDTTEEQVALRQHRDSEKRYRSLLDMSPEPIIVHSEQRIVFVNKASVKLANVDDEQELIGRSILDFIQPDNKETVISRIQRMKKGEVAEPLVQKITSSDGSILDVEITGVGISYLNKPAIQLVLRDITEQERIRRELEISTQRYLSLFENNPDGVYSMDLEGKLTNINQSLERILGYSEKELSFMTFHPVVAPEYKELTNKGFQNALNGDPQNYHTIGIHKNGQRVHLNITNMPIIVDDKIIGVYGIAKDITKKIEAEEKLNQIAYMDTLTGLPNRYKLNQSLEKAVIQAKQEGYSLAVLFIDYDNFKQVNDTLGHTIGDSLLSHIASRMKACLRNGDILSRQGGDEFLILLENVTESKVIKIIEQLIKEMRHPFYVNGNEIFTTPSIGIAMYPNSGDTAETLIKHADLAMYLAKEKGKNNYQFYTCELNEVITRKLMLENGLRKALQKEEFTLHYQPQFEIKTGKLVGVEALLRWNTENGSVSPAEFIPITEETGLIVAIGEWVIKEACRQIKNWHVLGLPKIPIAVNVSARQLINRNFPITVKKILKEVGVEPHYLELEITESVMLDVEGSSQVIKELKEVGVKIAIDDFGAGYSSLNVIKHVSIDSLKIDKSLLDDVMENNRMKSIMTTIISFGRNIDTEVIVEGIEKAEQVEFLKDLCVIGQGYYYSPPLGPLVFEKQWRESWNKKRKQ